MNSDVLCVNMQYLVCGICQEDELTFKRLLQCVIKNDMMNVRGALNERGGKVWKRI